LAAYRAGESIDVAELGVRDGWICGICGEPVLPYLSSPDPRCPSIDHVIPISHGGAHSWDNVQLAHVVCNVRRGARW